MVEELIEIFSQNSDPSEDLFIKDFSVIRERPKGRAIALSNHVEEISVILGLLPSTDPSNELAKLAKVYAKAGDYRQIQCLLQIDSEPFPIDLQVCKWCSKNTACTSESIKVDTLKISFDKRTQSIDKSLIGEYLRQKNFKTEGRIFCDEIHPFRPMIGDISRSLMLTPLNYFSKLHPNYSDSHWCHIFYSPPLGRTLTMFEAMILDIIVDETQDFRDVRKFPTCDEFSSWYGKKGIHGFISENMRELIDITQSQMYSGFNIDVELGSGLNRESKVEDFVSNLIEDLHHSHRHSQINSDFPIAVERESCLIFVPKGYIGRLPWHSAIRIIRVIEIKDLSEICVLHHQDIDGVGFQHHMSKIVSHRNSNLAKTAFNMMPRCNNPPTVINHSIRRYAQSYMLQHWVQSMPRFSVEQKNLLVIDWFSPSEIFESQYANLFYRNKANTSGDQEQLNHFTRVYDFIDKFYTVPENLGYVPNSEELREFKQLIKAPHYQKMTPYEALTDLCQSSNSLVKKFLFCERGESPNTRSKDLESITFELNWKEKESSNIASNQADNGGTFSVNDRRRLVRIYREIENPDSANFSVSPFNHAIEGQVDMKIRQLRRLSAALDYGFENTFADRESAKSESSLGGIWVSSGLEQAMTEDIADHIVAQVRYYCNHSTMCCALNDEMEQIGMLIGVPEKVLEKVCGDTKFCIWNPPSAASEFSPNFVFLGNNRRI